MQKPLRVIGTYYKKSIVVRLDVNKMRILQRSIFILILIALICSQFSCGVLDVLEQGSVLYRILRKLKFRVTKIAAEYPSRLKSYDVLFLQDLNKAPLETEIKKIQDFVKDGGTLIVSGGNHQAMEELVAAYVLKLRRLPNRLRFSQRLSDEPFFPLHPVDEIHARAYFVIDTSERNAVVLYGTEDNAVVATLRDGEGRVFFTTSAYLFNDSGLRHSSNATFLYNLMSTLPRNARIGLAESRYFTHESKPSNSFTTLVFKTPGGLAAVYICLILFVFLTLRGRRFGKPLDVRENNRRLSSEYVHAMTALYQKGNTRGDILQHIRDKFRADLGTRWRVNPNLDTTSFLEELTQRGAVDEEGNLTNLVRDLERSDNISESQLPEIARRVETYRETSKIGKAK